MDDPELLLFFYINPQLLETTDTIFRFSKSVLIFRSSGCDLSRLWSNKFCNDGKDSRYIKVEHTSFAFLTGKFDPAQR